MLSPSAALLRVQKVRPTNSSAFTFLNVGASPFNESSGVRTASFSVADGSLPSVRVLLFVRPIPNSLWVYSTTDKPPRV